MQEVLKNIAFAVSLTVILAMTGAFSIMYIAYVRYKCRHIQYGHEDEAIRADAIKEYERKQKNGETFPDYMKNQLMRQKKGQRITDTIFACFLGLIVVIGIGATAYRCQGEQVFIADTTFLTIQTDSMSVKSEDNAYYAQLPDDQIAQYSVIAIRKVQQSELKQFDIIAFEDKGTVYVHRIVSIRVENGVTFYTAQGDANPGSMVLERNLTYDQIIGRYTGFQSFGLGVALIYLSSNIGLIAWIFCFVFLLVLDLSESVVDKHYEKRILYFIGEYEAEALRQNAGDDSVLYDWHYESYLRKKFSFGGEHILRYNRSFEAKLIQSSDALKKRYSAVKNVFLSYASVRSRISWKRETFRYKRQKVAWLAIRGKTLCLFLPVAAEKYDGSKYKVRAVQDDVSMYRIRGTRTMTYAKELIVGLLEDAGAKPGKESAVDWYVPYQSTAACIEKGLIRRTLVPAQANDPEETQDEKDDHDEA